MKNIILAVAAVPYFFISTAVMAVMNNSRTDVQTAPEVEVAVNEEDAVIGTKYVFTDDEGSTIKGERPSAVVEFTEEDVKRLNTPRAVVIMDNKNAKVQYVRMPAMILFADRAGITIKGSKQN